MLAGVEVRFRIGEVPHYPGPDRIYSDLLRVKYAGEKFEVRIGEFSLIRLVLNCIDKRAAGIEAGNDLRGLVVNVGRVESGLPIYPNRIPWCCR